MRANRDITINVTQRDEGNGKFAYVIEKLTGAITVFSAGNREHRVLDRVDEMTAKDLAANYKVVVSPKE